MATLSETVFRDIKLTKAEKAKYLLPETKDFEILYKVRKLEEKKLSPPDRRMVQLIKTQLEKEWRVPLLKELQRISQRY